MGARWADEPQDFAPWAVSITIIRGLAVGIRQWGRGHRIQFGLEVGASLDCTTRGRGTYGKHLNDWQRSKAKQATPPPYEHVGSVRMSKQGRRAERKAIKLLEAEGYVCTRAGGAWVCSMSSPIGAADVRCVQVKTGTARLSAAEREPSGAGRPRQREP